MRELDFGLVHPNVRTRWGVWLPLVNIHPIVAIFCIDIAARTLGNLEPLVASQRQYGGSVNQALTRQFRLLYVCRANECRSAMAELLLVRAIDAAEGSEGEWSVRSAGVAARTGRPMQPAAAQILREWGIDSTGFSSRQLTPDVLDGCDLILTAEREHRAAVVRLDPAAADHTFTMRQFARLLQHSPQPAADDGAAALGVSAASAGRALVRRAQASRGQVATPAQETDDVADPVGGSLKAFRDCAMTISRSQAVLTLQPPEVQAAGSRRWWRREPRIPPSP